MRSEDGDGRLRGVFRLRRFTGRQIAVGLALAVLLFALTLLRLLP